eukprot:TRINITY_DN7958_c0_g1_i1.p1 TRINITY_DN7958_c0_g1~~TRINITY_DN7958_c0_g1_i1.p1  ORF type:complete len:363 (-),score=58.42 TRINITY_DN7958_c0_g1_i1:180-1268(-)
MRCWCLCLLCIWHCCFAEEKPSMKLLNALASPEPLALHVLDITAEPSTLGPAARRAAELHGAFLVDGHGIDPEILTQSKAALQEFFDLPQETKQEIALAPGFPSILRGYVPFGQERVYALEGDADSATDPVEKFSISPGPNYNVSEGDNLWPAKVPQLRPLLEKLYFKLFSLAKRVFTVLEHALELRPGFFDQWITPESLNVIRFLHYPGGPSRSSSQLRMAPHTDKNPFTLLPSDPSESLEYLTNGVWQRVGYRPGAFLVHLGDSLKFWTSGHWDSNWHRVGRPRSTAPRLAFAHFLSVDNSMKMVPFGPYATSADAAESRELNYGTWLEKQFADKGYYSDEATEDEPAATGANKARAEEV